MKYRIAMWAIAGFLLAGFWAVYGFAPAAFTSGDPLIALVRFTCPSALLSFCPIRLYSVLLAKATTDALAGPLVETLRQRLSHAE